MALPFRVVLAFYDSQGHGALVSRDIVGAVKVEEHVAHPKGDKFCDPQASDGSQACGKTIPIVEHAYGSSSQELVDHCIVDGEE